MLKYAHQNFTNFAKSLGSALLSTVIRLLDIIKQNVKRKEFMGVNHLGYNVKIYIYRYTNLLV